MRTTLTLDDDVAHRLRKLQQEARLPWKELVNRALREGLNQLDAPEPRREPFTIPTRRLGGCLLPNLDNVAEVLAVAEGEDFP